jgi:hypothetical protein
MPMDTFLAMLSIWSDHASLTDEDAKQFGSFNYVYRSIPYLKYWDPDVWVKMPI